MTVSSNDFKAALAAWPSGVTVVSVGDRDQYRAVTVSAFCSVSLEPPLVLVSINNESSTLEQLSRVGCFAISVLGADQADVSRACASPDRISMSDVRYALGTNGSPLVLGAVIHLECSVESLIPAGDHHLVLGRVSRAATNASAPLLYWSRQYGTFKPHDGS